LIKILHFTSNPDLFKCQAAASPEHPPPIIAILFTEGESTCNHI